jgi:hypothetical protein
MIKPTKAYIFSKMQAFSYEKLANAWGVFINIKFERNLENVLALSDTSICV